MEVIEFIGSMPSDRKVLFTALHEIIVNNDPAVRPVVKPMMGKDMILYEDRGYMKYGLANTKKHMSLHCLPIYMVEAMHAKFEALLPAAKVQKGCINFTDEEAMPQAVVESLIVECASVNIADMLEKRKKK